VELREAAFINIRQTGKREPERVEGGWALGKSPRARERSDISLGKD